MTPPDATRDERHLTGTLRSLSFGALWNALRYPFVFLSVLVFLPMMGEHTYGRYSLFLSVCLIWDRFTQVGMTQIFGRFVPEVQRERPGQVSELLHGLMFYGVLLVLVVVAAGATVFLVFRPARFDPRWIPMFGLLLLAGKLQGSLFAFLYGLNRIGRFSAREPMRSAFTFVAVVVLYHLFGLTGALWGLVVNELALLAVAACWTRPYLFRKPSRPSFARFKPYLLFGLTFYVPSFLFSLLQRSGNVFLSSLGAPFEEIALYDVANQFLLLAGMALRLLMSMLIPSLTVLYVAGKTADAHRWQSTAMAYCGMTIMLGWSAVVLLARPLLALWRGPEIAAGIYGNAVIIAAALAPMLISQVGLNLAVLEKKPAAYAWSVGAGVLCMALGCVALIPGLQSRGAAVATVCGYAGTAAVFFAWKPRMLWSLHRRFFAAMAAGLVFLPACLFARDGWTAPAAWLLSTAAYAGLLLRLRIARLSDLQRLVAAIRDKQATPPSL